MDLSWESFVIVKCLEVSSESVCEFVYMWWHALFWQLAQRLYLSLRSQSPPMISQYLYMTESNNTLHSC